MVGYMARTVIIGGLVQVVWWMGLVI